MRDAAFVKACSLIERFRKESQHWRKLLYQVSDEQSVANKALTDIAKHCGLKSWTIPQLVESVGLALAERDSFAGTYSRAQRRLLAEKQTEIMKLEAERDELRKIVEMVHADLGIQRGDHVGEAIGELKKEASDATARQRMTEVRALKYSAQAEDARREIERLRSEVESLRAKLTIHSDEMTALAAERDAHAAEVESLRAKIAAKTVQWPEWAKVGARVRVRSKDCMTTQQSDRVVGEELVISKVDRRDWTIRAESHGWVHVSDLEPVAEHTQPAVAVTRDR